MRTIVVDMVVWLVTRLHWNNMDMHMEDNLPSGDSIVLNNPYSVGFDCVLDCLRQTRSYFEDIGCFIFRHVIDVLIVLLGDDEGVTNVDGVVAQKSGDLLVFIDHACRGFFADDFAEYTVLGHSCHTFQRFNGRI